MNRCSPARSLAFVGAFLAALASLGACDPSSSGGSVTPTGHGSDSELEPEGNFEGESIDELRLRLDHLSEEQQQQVRAASQDPAACEELCELSQAICEVKTKMCELADEHVGDDEYQDLCRDAKLRCRQASDSCVACVQHHQRAGHSSATSSPASCEGAPED